MWPIIVSYYTKNTLYENQVEDLIRSCQDLGLPYDVVPIESLGSWSKNCCFKPSFLLQKLLLHRRPIVWTDADSVIVKKPELFTHLNCDMGVHIREHLPETDSSKVLSGTIFINYTSRAKRLLKLWLLECKRRVEREGLVLDQEALRDVIYRYPHGALIDHLPSSYCQIFDKKQEEAPVFIHYQASRIERALNSDNQILGVFLKELHGEDLKTFQTHQEI
jgi:hypothetical protein